MGDYYAADLSLKGKVRRHWARLRARRNAERAPEGPLVTFGFDDPPEGAARAGAEILEARGLRGTYYVSAGLLGTESPWLGAYATEADVRRLASAGHEIACHTYSHIDCAKASPSEMEAEVERNAAALAALGAPPPRTFAYPHGEVSVAAKATLGRRFGLLRGVKRGVVVKGSDLAQAPGVGIEREGGEAMAVDWLDRAAASRGWLMLYTHDLRAEPSLWGAKPEAFDRVVDAAVARGFTVVTAAEGLDRVRRA